MIITIPFIIRQDYLNNSQLDSVNNESLNLYISFSNAKIECSGNDLQKFVADYADFPIL